MIKGYFRRVKERLQQLAWFIKSDTVDFDMLSDEMGILKGKIVFLDGSQLEFKELVSKSETDYRFQYMDKSDSLIIRWDTAPHHKELDNFPYHIHTPNEEEKSSPRMNLVKILDIVERKVIRNL